jgi:transcriptional antiterminator RfaH
LGEGVASNEVKFIQRDTDFMPELQAIAHPLSSPAETEAPESPLADKWFLAYTKPRFESVAQVNLQQQGFDVYLPLYKKFKKSETGTVTVFEPMFPRYIFFRPSRPSQSIATVRSTKGVNNLVRFGFEPAALADETLQMIRHIEESRNHVTVQDASPIKAGQSVRLKHTALNNLQGLVQSVGSKRIEVLLEIMGRPTVVQVEHHQLEVD